MAGEQFLEMLRNLLARGPSEEDLRYQDEVIREASTGPFGGDYNANLGTVYEALLRPPGETFDPVQRRSSPGETIAAQFPGRPEGSLQNIGTEMVMGALEPDPTGMARTLGVGFPAMLKLAQNLQGGARVGRRVIEDVPTAIDVVRPGSRPGLRLFRSETAEGLGPVANERVRSGGDTFSGSYWSTDPDVAGSYGTLYATDAAGEAPPPGRYRTVEADLPLDPSRVLDTTDAVPFRKLSSEADSAPGRFLEWARSWAQNPDLPEVNRNRISRALAEWDRGEIDPNILMRELTMELNNAGLKPWDEFGRAGFDARIQHMEENLMPENDAREVIVYNRQALRPMNQDDPGTLLDVLDMMERLSGGR